MVPYLIVLVCCTCLYIAAEKSIGALRQILIGTGLLLPCLLAAFRDETIGTDVTVYVQPLYETSLHFDYHSTMTAFSASQPVGFISLIWVVTNTFHSFAWVLGVMQALTIIPVYIVLRLLLSSNIWAGMFLYLCLLFPVSLNITKQAIAMSIMFLAFVYCVRRKPAIFTILSVVAVTIHQTAIVMFLLYIAYVLIDSKRRSSNISVVKELSIRLFFYLSVILLVVCGNFVVSFISSLRGSYAYISTHTDTEFSLIPIIFYLLLLCAYYVYTSSAEANQFSISEVPSANYVFFIEILAEIGFLLMETSLISQGLNRFSYYFQFYCLLFIPLLSSHKRFDMSRLIQLTFLMLALSTFVYNCLMGYQGIYPYTSTILRITQGA